MHPSTDAQKADTTPTQALRCVDSLGRVQGTP